MFNFKNIAYKALALSAMALPSLASAQADTTYPTQVPESVDAALASAQAIGTNLAQKVGPVVMAIGVAFLGVAVVWFAIRLVSGFLARRRGV